MKKLKLKLLLCALSVAGSAYAEEPAAVQAENFAPVPVADENAAVDEFSRPNEELGQIEEIKRPSCVSAHFQNKVLAVIQDILNKDVDDSTIALRRKHLLLAHLNSFEEVSAAGFSAETDENVADALIMLKINQKIPEKDIVVCRQSSAVEKPLYVMLYPYIDNYKGVVINMNRYTGSREEVSFIYP